MVEWLVKDGLMPYGATIEAMENVVNAIVAEKHNETVWLLEHPALYTMGTSASSDDIHTSDFPIHVTGRGGQVTYHGPGQRIVYVMMDLRKRRQDLRQFVHQLELWIVDTLAELGIVGKTHPERIGVWVNDAQGVEKKIAAIGLRIRRWVTYHGLALNVDPNLEHYNGIVPCGISDYGVTSLAALGVHRNLRKIDEILKKTFHERFETG